MHEDPIVAGTRKLREEMMNEVGNDLDKLFEYLKQREALHPDRLVSFPPRRPETAGAGIGDRNSGSKLLDG
jgi:hypothetical protein